VEFGILGPLAAWQDGRELELGAPKQRAVLAVLLLQRNEPVTSSALVYEVWGEQPPPTALKALHGHVSHLRKVLGRSVLASWPSGYELRVDDGALDAERFSDLLGHGRRLLAAGAATAASEALAGALALWRGPPLVDFRYESFARNEIGRLTDLRLVALEQRLEADLALGRHAEAVPELEALAREHPLRESLCGLLMLALYRAGRQADALATYRDRRTTLVEELGLDPGQALQRLEQAILRQDPALDPPRPPAPVPPASPSRKVATVLCAGVGTGEPDPELQRLAGSRFVESAVSVVKRHGAAVAAGADALTAVFGVPAVHEDDALRAVRAAVELRGAHPDCRVGVATGEVLTGAEEQLATGEPVTLAARLEHAAGRGEVLIGDGTLQHLRGTVEVKRNRSGAHRLVALKAIPERRHRSPMVGRGRELEQLEQAFDGLASGRCRLFTIVGDAGVGKSRLVAEFLAGLGAEVVRGRCLPYGEGITYWPVADLLGQLGTRPAEPAAATAIASLLGESDEPAAADEIAWAVRRTLERAAQQQPLVVVLDDIQWGEDAFLDLVEHVADFARNSPILLLCMARPELDERRPSWADGKPNATRIPLDPLSPDEADELIGLLAPQDDELRARVREAGAGNPLFIEEMLAFARHPGGEGVVPPTIKALLAARLDQLDAAERAVLQRGAVEGEVFHRGAVEALAPAGLEVEPLLTTLVRKELVRPDRARLSDEDAFRFRHLLLRDAAYDALPKAARAGLHEQLARWLERHGAELVELDELTGYHLEQASRYLAELGQPSAALAAAARRQLTAAGSRALLREDPVAALNLLTRASALLPYGAVDVMLELELNQALIQGGDTAGAGKLARANAQRAAAAGDLVAELCARIDEALCVSRLEPEGAHDRVFALIAEALPVFDAARDQLALWFGNWALGFAAIDRWQMGRARAALEQSLLHARRAGLARQELTSLRFLTNALRHGPTPIEEVVGWVGELEARGHRQSWLPMVRAEAVAMAGGVDEARTTLAELRAGLAERGARNALLNALATSRDVELLVGGYGAAEALALEACRYLEERNLRITLATAKAELAQARYGLGLIEEAETDANRAAELAASDDVATQSLSRQIRAKVLAERGEAAVAEQLAREAIAIVELTDVLVRKGDAWADLAEVLELAGKHDEAAAALDEAIALYERKGSVASIDRVRARLTA
jgi:DNA-binding SARP family transcriptional activator